LLARAVVAAARTAIAQKPANQLMIRPSFLEKNQTYETTRLKKTSSQSLPLVSSPGRKPQSG
jgi:hypothetical protein